MEGTEDQSWAQIVVGPGYQAREHDHLKSRDASPGSVATRFVRGDRCTTKERFFEEWSTALNFPDYFGHNWDAYEEVLDEMLDRNGSGNEKQARQLMVLISDSVQLLRDESPQDLKIFVNIMEQASLGSSFAQNPTELRVLFQCEPETADTTLHRLNKVGIDPVLLNL